MYPHRIRLRGPWECTLKSEAGTAGVPWRVAVPCRLRDVGLPGLTGQVCLSRKFGYPGQIDSFERVWLTFADICGKATIALNGRQLGEAATACEFDVTSLLKPHNRLEVGLWAASDEAGLVGEVALEVRCAVFLRNIQVQHTEASLVVTGELSGSWPEPFDLYFFVRDVQVDYLSVQTAGADTPFRAELKQPAESASPCTVRVDLVQGPTLWQRWEWTAASP